MGMARTVTRSGVSLVEAAEDREAPRALALRAPARAAPPPHRALPRRLRGRAGSRGNLCSRPVVLVHNLLARDPTSTRSPRDRRATGSRSRTARARPRSRWPTRGSSSSAAHSFARGWKALATTGSSSRAVGPRSLPCSGRLERGLSASAVVCDEFSHFVSETLGPQSCGAGVDGGAADDRGLRGAGADAPHLDPRRLAPLREAVDASLERRAWRGGPRRSSARRAR